MGRVPSPATRIEDPVKGKEFDDEGYVNVMHRHLHSQVPPRRHHRLPQTQALLSPEPWDPERLPIISRVARHATNNRAAYNEYLQPDRRTGRQHTLHQPPTPRTEPGAASLGLEPLRIPRRGASILRSNDVRLSRDSRTSEPSHYRAAEERHPARRVSARPVLDGLALSPNSLLEVPPRPDGYTPIANMYPHTTQSHPPQSYRPERRRNRQSISTTPTDQGVHLLRQPFYNHLYNIDRRSVRQRVAATTPPAAPRSRVSAIVHPSASTEPTPTRPHTPYPRPPPGHQETFDSRAYNGGGILGTFDWETNVENLENERLLAILAEAVNTPADENDDTTVGEGLWDTTDETMFEQYASWAQASYHLI
ncbi:MAG: hypothetical protein Q9208_004674 [Pyrenodesmia sp. 3 TL-2023]